MNGRRSGCLKGRLAPGQGSEFLRLEKTVLTLDRLEKAVDNL
jgi:hypothetical protein